MGFYLEPYLCYKDTQTLKIVLFFSLDRFLTVTVTVGINMEQNLLMKFIGHVSLTLYIPKTLLIWISAI